MSAAVICQGCGQPVPIPEDYRRNKIQCPGCGVICPVPEDAARGTVPARPRPAAEPSFEDLWGDPEPGPAPKRAAEPPLNLDVPGLPKSEPPAADLDARPAARKKAPAVQMFPCRRCGRLVHKQRECPDCDKAPENEEGLEPLAAVPRMEVDEEPQEDAAEPYTFEGGDVPQCPKCHRDLAADGVVCLACGYDRRKRKKVAKTYEPLVRRWEADYTLDKRALVFGALQALGVFVAVGLGMSGMDLVSLVGSWLLLTALSSFLLGTYCRLDLVRERNGRVTLTKNWRACFVPLKPQPVDVRSYGELSTGQAAEAGCWEWAVFPGLLFSGLVPAAIGAIGLMESVQAGNDVSPWRLVGVAAGVVAGVIPAALWWYITIHKVTFFVALARDHGHADLYLYRGWSQAQMTEIATTLRDAARLIWDNG